MCRLFIVEDEEIIREGIEKNIDWKSNDVDIVGTAGNGRACIEKLELCMPEVILSDIKMPFMDGMELVEYLYEFYPQIKVVLLTAFDEFEYAKKALNYKVCQYIMKYEENEKILTAVLKAGKEYKVSLSQMERVKQSEVLLENKILRDLLFYDEKSEEIEKNLLNSKINFLYDDFFVTCILIKESKNMVEGYNLLQKDIKNLNCEFNLYFCKAEQKLYVITNFDRKNLDLFREFIGKLDYLLRKEMHIFQLKAVVGQVYKGIEGINKSYDEVNDVISLYQVNHHFDKDEKIIIVNNNENTNKKTVKQIMDYINEHYQEKNICLDTIAKNVHLTPSYVSTLFKKEKSINISDYIIKIRIERAKYLLMTTDMKTYEISDEIGYVNSQYFSVLFKRNTGLSPTEYRQEVSDKLNENFDI
ncbi:response regulator [Clostridium sp. SHJSY1]|uniref:response regulator transcription factor n=1 Tax=Clostridium sp. SHJSY1 TaxID=2942483 RepID=UPI0028745BBE|nr:response regulator [Clostridium sp. SHJSY1]MDS0525135.1 response regulator [Clostridium sp. SHJSY1]